MDNNKRVIAWILSRPEGKQFLAACMFVIIFLSGVIISMDNRNQRQQREFLRQMKICNDEKQEIKSKDDERFLNFIIIENEKKQSYIDKIDSFRLAAKKINEHIDFSQ